MGTRRGSTVLGAFGGALVDVNDCIFDPHFYQRCRERGFSPDWVAELWNNPWYPSTQDDIRFEIEGFAGGDQRWRLIVEWRDCGTTVVKTVVRLDHARAEISNRAVIAA